MTFVFDRRSEPRLDVRIPAVLLVSATATSLEGTIANFSEDGARVELDAGRDAMLAFLEEGMRLHLYETRFENLYECELRWKQERALGVRFIDLATRATRTAIIARLRAEQSPA